MPLKETLIIHVSLGERENHPSYGIHTLNEGLSDLVPSQNSFPFVKALQRQANSPSKGSQVTRIMLSNPYIIK
jgi:hypothetical protein